MVGTFVLHAFMTAPSTRLRKSGHPRRSAGRKPAKRKVAVFDIDGTIFRSSLAIELVEELLQSGLFPPRAKRVYERERERWRERLGSYEEYIEKVVVALWRYLDGIPLVSVERAAERVLRSKRYYTYRFTRDLALLLKKRGYFLLAISHSPSVVVSRFAKGLGFDKAYGTLAAYDENGILTGRVTDREILANKANILKRVIKKHNLTLEDSVGVGDTETDVTLLRAVENPIAFNPNTELYKIAKKKKWRIVVERKDVVYDSEREKKFP